MTTIEEPMPMNETMYEGETYDLDHHYVKNEMYAANVVWTLLAAIMATKSVNAVLDADYTSLPTQAASIYQYSDMALKYGNALFWTVGTLLQLVSMAWVAVDINIYFWMVISSYVMIADILVGLGIWYAYDANKLSATSSDNDWADALEVEDIYESAHEAWLMVTHMMLADKWFAGQWDMLAVEKRKEFVEMHEAEVKARVEANKARMGIEMEDKDDDEEADEEETEVLITAAGLWRTLNF